MAANSNGGGPPLEHFEHFEPREDIQHTPVEIPGILRAIPSEHSGPRKLNTDIPNVLPHERVFPIQIGSELFRLSGASISSDAPSYFSQYFQCQLRTAKENGDESGNARTLYIDRDPVTFRDISLHLQGYHVEPRDATHFVRLFTDAQFYYLPRLISQLYTSPIYITIGSTSFRIPRDLFNTPGNTPNFFTLGFAVLFSSPTEVFPGLSREGLLRPPSIMPPEVPNRSAETFQEVLDMLKGYPVEVKSEAHRERLVKDCKYFHFRGLEQKLVRCERRFNRLRGRWECTIRFEDVRQSGISVVWESERVGEGEGEGEVWERVEDGEEIGFVNYKRPFEDEEAYELVLEIGGECMELDLGSMLVEFTGEGKRRVGKLLEILGSGWRSEGMVECVVGEEASVFIDGKEGTQDHMDSKGKSFFECGVSGEREARAEEIGDDGQSRKRRRIDSWEVDKGKAETWVIKKGLWRLRVSKKVDGHLECVLVAVKLDAFSGELGRNTQRGFLS